MIWLKQGIAEDDLAGKGPLAGNLYPTGDTGGHVDEFCRFASADTILLATVSPEERDSDPVMRISYDRMEESYRILQAAIDQDGHKLKIIRVPVADRISLTKTLTANDKGELAFFATKPGQPLTALVAASYLNFFVSNDVVLVPAYGKESQPASTKGKDAKVKQIFQRVFPTRTIIPIQSEDLHYGGGGMHCATQEQPTAEDENLQNARSPLIR
ncbi:MAG TPA: agmatine deiminase family protein [Chthoniobacterales bacterium]|jgi:agmatine deiminase